MEDKLVERARLTRLREMYKSFGDWPSTNECEAFLMTCGMETWEDARKEARERFEASEMKLIALDSQIQASEVMRDRANTLLTKCLDAIEKKDNPAFRLFAVMFLSLVSREPKDWADLEDERLSASVGLALRVPRTDE